MLIMSSIATLRSLCVWSRSVFWNMKKMCNEKNERYESRTFNERMEETLDRIIRYNEIFGVLQASSWDAIWYWTARYSWSRKSSAKSGMLYVKPDWRKNNYWLQLKRNQIKYLSEAGFELLNSSSTYYPYYNASAIRILQKTGHALKYRPDGNVYWYLYL